MLYYGYFQDNYSSFNNFRSEDSMRLLFKKERLTIDDWKTVIRLENNSLQRTPFELKKLNTLFIAYKKIGDTITAKEYLDKVRKIAFTILSSGDGQSEETGLHVLEISDEYAMVSILGYEYGGKQTLTHGLCDYLVLKDNNDNVKGLYFNIKQIFKCSPKLYGDNEASLKRR